MDRHEFLERAGQVAAGAGIFGISPALAEIGSTGPTPRSLRELARELDGPVVTPGRSAYALGRLLFDTRFDAVHPRAIAYCTSTEDVERAVRWARRHGVRIVARSGGHSYAGYSTIGNGVVVDVTRMNRVRPHAHRTATVGAGAVLIDVYARLAAAGVTIPAGSCPSVGIAGLTLGGGMSYAARKFGLTCDNLRALTIVTGKGKILHCSPREHADLFWACRGGGGGNFGIATSFHFRTHAAGSVAYYEISWPWRDAAEVVAAWQEFAPDAPDELFSTLYVATGPKIPGRQPAITSGGQYFGTEQALRSLLAPLVAAGNPKRVTVGTLPYMAALMRWAGCHGSVAECHRADKSKHGTLPRATFKAKSDFFDEPIPSAGIQALLTGIDANQADPRLGRAELVFDAYGGAINRVAPAATAFVHRRSRYSIQYLSFWTPQAPAAPNLRWLRDYYRTMRPYASGFAYQNNIDPELATWRHAYYGSNLRRLVAVRKKYDPHRLFRFAQAI